MLNVKEKRHINNIKFNLQPKINKNSHHYCKPFHLRRLIQIWYTDTTNNNLCQHTFLHYCKILTKPYIYSNETNKKRYFFKLFL